MAPTDRFEHCGKRPGWLRPPQLLLGLLASWGLPSCCALSGPRYAGPPSDHFDGSTFINQQPSDHGSFVDFLRWQLTAEPGPWEARLDATPGPKPPLRVGRGELRVTFIGHATLLVQMDGKNILTDPVYSERVSPVGWVGPRRFRPPGIRFEDLPPIDVVAVSHSHYDHMDLPTLRRLSREHAPRFFVGLGNGPLLRQQGIEEVTEVDWWQSVDLGDLDLVSVPAQHFSGRGLCDRDATLWTGYVFRGPAGVVYFAGDTGMGPHFRQIRERFGPPRLAILPIGAYLPRWFMQRVHIGPGQAADAHRILEAHRSVAMHFGTFALGDDGMDQAPAELATALRRRGIDDDSFWVLGFGEGRALPRP